MGRREPTGEDLPVTDDIAPMPHGRKRRWLPYVAGGTAGLAVVGVILAVVGAFRTTAPQHVSTGTGGAAQAVPAQIATSTALPGVAGAPSPAAGTAPKLDVRAVLRAVEPGVVDITDYAAATGGAVAQPTGEGTGMILDGQGDVLTNAHVVNGGASYSIQPSGQTTVYAAKVLGVDATDDVAVMRIQNPGSLSPVPLGHSSSVQVGDPVVAIGNALGLAPGGPSVTQGIISALGRTLATDNGNGGSEHLSGLIQTDAPINPGNSGGPLIDANAQVIGMNTAVSTQGQNIGFVIPIDRITPLISDLEQGTVPPSTQGYLGVGLQTPPSGTGAEIATVTSGSPAAFAGLQVGDVITAIDGQAVLSSDDAVQDISQYAAGTKVTITYTRGGTSHTATVTLGSRPPGSG
jgi:putative serine protease PepD